MNVNMDFIPDGKSGAWEVSSFELKEMPLSQMMSILKTGRGCPAGKYKRLKRDKDVIMSNTPDEINDFLHFTNKAHGSILINGLGLGCIVKVLLDNSKVKSIDVIEVSEDVIKLVAPHFKDKRLNIIHADAFSYKPPKGKKYDFVWHDIWDSICADNLPEMIQLHRKYERKTKRQDSWAMEECRMLQRHNW